MALPNFRELRGLKQDLPRIIIAHKAMLGHTLMALLILLCVYLFFFLPIDRSN